MLLNIIASFCLLGAAVAQTCNGNAALCSRKYSNVTLIGTHDSAFVGILPTDNQFKSVTDQLDAGIRFLQAQTHLKSGVLQLCHTTCAEKDAGTLLAYLTTVNTWLAANPNEVLTILLTNGDSASVSLFGAAMVSSGLSQYAYAPGSKLTMSQWPTLQTMISNGDRLVMFLGKSPSRYTDPAHTNLLKKIMVRTLTPSLTSSTNSSTFSRQPTMSPTLTSPPVRSTAPLAPPGLDS
jgi:hypothetical protein